MHAYLLLVPVYPDVLHERTTSFTRLSTTCVAHKLYLTFSECPIYLNVYISYFKPISSLLVTMHAMSSS
jgi:hypothetical protein